MIVPSWGAPATLGALLGALGDQTLDASRYEVLVVDAGADGGLRLLEELERSWEGAPLRILRGPLAGGPGARRNHGAGRARRELLAFTDTDCEPERGWLEAGLRAFASGAEMVQGRTLPPDGAGVAPFAHFHSIERETALYEACNIFYARTLFERLGGFPTRYFAHVLEPFGEDAALGWKARRAGVRFRFEPAALVRHAVVARSLASQLRYQWRGRAFPLLVGEAPELRAALFYRRLFLSRRSAGFKAALAGALLARRLPLAAALVAPYARQLLADLRSQPASALARARLTAVGIASDAVLCAALAYGSARFRELVL